MTLNELNPTIRTWLYAREVMRRLGFTADELIFAINPSGRVSHGDAETDYGQPVIFVRLEAQGKMFNWTIGPIDLPAEEIEPAMKVSCDVWNTLDYSEEVHQTMINSLTVLA